MNKQTRIDFALRTTDLFENKKIVVRKTGDSLIGSIDNNNYYFDTLVHGIYKDNDNYPLEPLLAIINSKPATFFYRLLHDIKGKVFAKISLDNLASFPLPSNLKLYSNELTSFAELNSRKVSQFQILMANFLGLLSNKLGVTKISKKLQNWYQMEGKEFLKELSKAKVKLSLLEESEWVNYFKEQKQIAFEIKSEIDKTDKEIDQIVYRLYGLTEEEIQIIENNI